MEAHQLTPTHKQKELVELFNPNDFSIDDLLNDQNERRGV